LCAKDAADILQLIGLIVHYFGNVTPRQKAYRKKLHSKKVLTESPLFQWEDDEPEVLVAGHADLVTVLRPLLLKKLDSLLRHLSRLSLLRVSFMSINQLTNDPFDNWGILFCTVKVSNLSVPNGVKLRNLQQLEFNANKVALRDQIHMVHSEYSVTQLKCCLQLYCYSLFREGLTTANSHIYDDRNILVAIKLCPIRVLKFIFEHRVVFEAAQAAPLFRRIGMDVDGTSEIWTCDMVLRLDFFAVGAFTAKSMGCIGFTPIRSNSVADNVYLMYLLCKDNSENNRIYAGPLIKEVEDMWDNGFRIDATPEHGGM
jgi:hypothetical protein